MENRHALVLYDGPEHRVQQDGRSIYYAPLYKAARALDLLINPD